MWLNQDFTCTFTHICCFYSGSTIYIYPPIPSPESLKNILLLIRERITKNILVFPYEINAQVILLLPLATLSQEMSAPKKEKYEEIKRSKCSEPRKKRKSETRGKNGQVFDSRIRVTRYPPERRKRKRKKRASHSPHKVSKSKEGMDPLKEQK